MAVKAVRLILCLSVVPVSLAVHSSPAQAGLAMTLYRHGDWPIYWPTFPLCRPFPQLQFGSAQCNSCCSEPDAILKDLYRGPDRMGSKSLDEWYLDDFWKPLEAQITESTNRFTNQILSETASIGGFMDAQNHMRVKTMLQKGMASAANKNIPSEALCRYGTLAQGLAASEANSNAIKYVMSTRSFERQLLRANSAAGTNTSGNDEAVTKGQQADKDARWRQYASTFCHPGDQLEQGSGSDGACQGSNDSQYNKDISFTKTIASPPTLVIGPDEGSSKDTQSVNALADNLYAHDLTNIIPTGQQLDPNVQGNFENVRKYMMLRSVLAKRAVAENSFSSIAAMKAKGTSATSEHTVKLMLELGIPEEEAKKFVGENPSYYSQMEALTKKMYQSPAFYVNLMEGSTNVQRQQAAMKALELMQQRDMYKSLARSEMLFATLLEVYVSRQQGGLNKQAVQSQ